MKLDLYKDSVYYFKELSKVYHGSGDLRKCQQWLKQTINDLGVDVYLDNYNKDKHYGNVYASIPATDSNLESVIIQAHYDMVIVTNDLKKMKENGIELVQENSILHSKDYKTTIGADDGIGIALMLSIIKNRDNFKHGNIKFLMTADEETSMLGAKASLERNIKWFDYKYLVNLDSTDMSYIYCGCYSGIQNRLFKTFKTVKLKSKNIYELSITGLMGGHSSLINNSQANSIVLLSKLLLKLKDVQIISFDDLGHKVHNAIARGSKIIIACNNSLDEIKSIWNGFKWNEQFPKETKMKFTLSKLINNYKNGLSIKDSTSLLKLINELPIGAFKKFILILYYTTCNVSPLLSFDANKPSVKIELGSFVRTYEPTQVNKTNKKVEQIAKKYNFEYANVSTSPVWKQKNNSKLQKALIESNKQLGINSIAIPMPACIECCWFANKVKHLDIVSIGDGMIDPHLPTESINLKLYKRFCDSMLIFLQNFK